MNITLKKAPVVEQATISAPRGSFDLSNDAFVRAERMRRALIVISLVTIALLTALVLFGISAGIGTEKASNDMLSAQEEQTAALNELNKIDRAGPYPAEALRGHVTHRQEVVVAAIDGEYDYAALVAAINAAAPSGLSVTKIEFAEAAAPQAAPAPSPAAEDGSAAAPAAPTAPAGQTVTVSAVGSFESLTLFMQNVGTVKGLDQVGDNPTISDDGQGKASIEFTTGLTADALSKRSVDVKKLDSTGQPLDQAAQAAPAPTTAGGAQ